MRFLSFSRTILLSLLLIFAAVPFSSRAEPLVADLSSHLIAVSTGFSGAELLLYGATDGDGDVVVVIRGPEEETVVRKKERVAGVWINKGRQAFEKVPGYYTVAASGDLAKIVGNNVRLRKEIGIDRIQSVPSGIKDPAHKTYWKALLRNKIKMGLYPEKPGKVQILGGRLFRTDVVFPSNVPTGKYSVTAYLIRNGEIASTHSTPLSVSKTGVGAKVFEFAYRYSALYGIVAIFMAVFFGWAAGVVFRRL